MQINSFNPNFSKLNFKGTVIDSVGNDGPCSGPYIHTIDTSLIDHMEECPLPGYKGTIVYFKKSAESNELGGYFPSKLSPDEIQGRIEAANKWNGYVPDLTGRLSCDKD